MSLFTNTLKVVTVSGAILAGSILPLAGNAVEIRQQQTVFVGQPLLTNTSQASVGLHERYEFSITLPENASEALRTVTFQPVANSPSVDFYADSTKATVGDTEVSVTAATLNRDGSQLMEVTLDEPLAPGQTVTIQVRGPRTTLGPAMVGVLASADGPNAIPYFMGCLPTAAY